MARSEAARALQRLAADHATAERLALPLDTNSVTADQTILTVAVPILQQHVDLTRAALDPMMQGVLSPMTMGYRNDSQCIGLRADGEAIP